MTTQFPEDPNTYSQPGLFRRLAAICYDSLLCTALMFVVTGLYMMISYKLIGAEQYKALNDSGETITDPILTIALLSSLFLFFGYFWTKTGQTLGMQVWHLRVQNTDNTSISWKQAIIRFIVAILSFGAFGLGYLWTLVDPEKRSWHCLASNTYVARIPKRQAK